MNKISTINELPKDERPYERFLKYGSEALSDAELLAIILRTGTRGSSCVSLARSILASHKDGLLALCRVSVGELMKISGVGEIKAAQLKCIAELSRRISRESARKNLSFFKPSTVAEYYMETLRHKDREQLLCMMLDTKGSLIGEESISIGTVNQSLVSPREVFLAAFKHEAVNIILVHNHPSGDCTPSREDYFLTKRIQKAGELLSIELLDHVIVGDRKYISFAEQGLLDDGLDE